MTAPGMRTLSKSDFKIARTCDAKLWFKENGYPDNGEFNHYLQLLAQGGYMVEALATARYPEGVKLDYGRDFESDCTATLAYLQRENVTLFQGTLLHGRRLARVDILQKTGNTIRIVEVKAKSFDGAAHIASLAEGGAGAFRAKRSPYGILSNWMKYFDDITYQALLLDKLMPGFTVEPYLALVDTSKRSMLDNVPSLFRIVFREGTNRVHDAEYTGTPEQLAQLDLVTEVAVGNEVAMLREEIDQVAERYEAMLDVDFNPAWGERGSKCKECEFQTDEPGARSGFHHCWGDLAHADPHLLDLFSVGTIKIDGEPAIATMLSRGTASLLDIQEEWLCKKDGTVGAQAERQRRQLACTRDNREWHSDNLRGKIDRLQYPLHFIDFEACRLALPYHARMRPYGQVAFQWSCHTVESPGAQPVHSEWLNRKTEWPNHEFVLSLREQIGDTGSVVAWSPFEKSALKAIDVEKSRFDVDDPELSAWIAEVVSEERRMVDICKWATNDYYHPRMRGRTSIKWVMDALWKSDPEMRLQFTRWTGYPGVENQDPYNALPSVTIDGLPQDVREGTGAIRAYEAMMYGVEDAVSKDSWAQLLRQYCQLDTLSMVLIFEHWRRLTSAGEH